MPNNGAALVKTRVFLVDDHPVVRRGFRRLIEMESDLTVCGEAGGVAAALEQMLELKPDLAIVDLGLNQENGFELIQKLRLHSPQIKIVVLSMHGEALYMAHAMQIGAHGYVTKQEGTKHLVEAIRLVMLGKFYLSREITSRQGGKAGA